jgi:hypothetical protein
VRDWDVIPAEIHADGVDCTVLTDKRLQHVFHVSCRVALSAAKTEQGPARAIIQNDTHNSIALGAVTRISQAMLVLIQGRLPDNFWAARGLKTNSMFRLQIRNMEPGTLVEGRTMELHDVLFCSQRKAVFADQANMESLSLMQAISFESRTRPRMF